MNLQNLASSLNEFLLGREKTKQIHDIKNEYNVITGNALLRVKKIQSKMENTITYRIGLATGGIKRGL